MIYKQRSAVIEAYESGDYSPKRKQMRSGNYTEVGDCLYKWFTNARSSNIAISSEILAEKSKEFAKKFGVYVFKCSSGFIDRFKKNDAELHIKQSVVKAKVLIEFYR